MRADSADSANSAAAPPNKLDDDLEAALREAAAGQRAAMGIVYDATAAVLWRLLTALVADEAAAQAVLVQTYTRVWQQAPRWVARTAEHPVGHLSARAWVISVAVLIARNGPGIAPAGSAGP